LLLWGPVGSKLPNVLRTIQGFDEHKGAKEKEARCRQIQRIETDINIGTNICSFPLWSPIYCCDNSPPTDRLSSPHLGFLQVRQPIRNGHLHTPNKPSYFFLGGLREKDKRYVYLVSDICPCCSNGWAPIQATPSRSQTCKNKETLSYYYLCLGNNNPTNLITYTK